jgi:hypothetical protein
MPPNIGQQNDRPEVTRRVNFATRNSLNLRTVQNTKSPFSNPRVITPKLYGQPRPTRLENYLIYELGALLNSP